MSESPLANPPLADTPLLDPPAQPHCAQCGYPLGGPERLMGLCPRCLLARVADVRREVLAQMDRVRPFPDAPTPAELTAALDQVEVLEQIGHGGMGIVYRARQKSLHRDVALKILPAENAADPAAAARFAEEARILGRLSHPNIVVALDSGQVNNWLYLVMELVPGQNLRDTLLRHGPLASHHALEIATQISSALAYAHAQGIVHRDIKPENILLQSPDADAGHDLDAFFAAGGRVRVADFGIARLLEHTDVTLTAPHHILGTVDYLAPECRHGRAASGAAAPGPAADVYALGVLLYEMLTGRVPAGHFPPPSKLARDVSPALDAVVMKALSAESHDRYQTGHSLLHALTDTRRHHFLPRRAWRIAAAGAAAAMAALLLLYVMNPDHAATPTPAPQPTQAITSSPDPAPTPEPATPPPPAIPPTPAPTLAQKDIRVLIPGDTVEALWGDQWLPATVLQREGRRVQVQYQGENQTEWLGPDRLNW